MYWHSSVGLRGPISGARDYWNNSAVERNTAVVEAVRADLVARVRQEIADGCYDTPEKWDAALEHMFARLDLD